MSWEQQARCRNIDPETFFAPGVRTERRAKAICSRCPVRGDCLSYALESRAEFGVWGGLNATERRRLLRRGIPTKDWRPDLTRTAARVRAEAAVRV